MSNPKKKISVIVPIYNVAEYLGKCAESIINQTFSDIEVILVDDGSTDGSTELCDRYALKDSRIKVIHKKNGGLSSARNAGLDKAGGGYITFVDGDDYLEPDALEKMSAKIGDADILCYNWQKVYRGGKIEKCDVNGAENGIYNRSDLNTIRYKLLAENGLGSVCIKMFTRNIVNDLRFDESMIYVEDQIFCCEAFTRAESAVFNDGCYYNYVIRDTGIIRSYNPRRLEYLNRFIDYLNAKAEEWGIEGDTAARAIGNRIIGFAAAELHNIVFSYGLGKKDGKKLFAEIAGGEIMSRIDKTKLSGKKNKLLYKLISNNKYTTFKLLYSIKNIINGRS